MRRHVTTLYVTVCRNAGPIVFALAQAQAPAPGPVPYFKQPSLPYPYDALEPYIDERTVEIHWTKHTATYFAELNGALAKAPSLQVRLRFPCPACAKLVCLVS